MVKLEIWRSGTKFWFLDKICYRARGPAITWYDGETIWVWDDREVTEYEHMMLSAQEQSNG